MATVLVISDLQAPFQHKDSLAFLSAMKTKFKPNLIVNIGDEVDNHAISDYDSDPDGFSAGHELQKAIASLQSLYKMFPQMCCCISNHTSRPFRRAFKAGIPRIFLKDYRTFLEAPKGWSWADYWEIDGIRYEHGDAISGGGKNAAPTVAIKNMQSTVFGHFHSHAGIHYVANPKVLLFGMNVGCLIDIHAYAFAYGKTLKEKPIIGAGVVKDGIPFFQPMLLNSKGRWTGKL